MVRLHGNLGNRQEGGWSSLVLYICGVQVTWPFEGITSGRIAFNGCFQSARGLAQSTTWRTIAWLRHERLLLGIRQTWVPWSPFGR